jgi:uncharacterized protein YprB with RNaseH-like and TPR domain
VPLPVPAELPGTLPLLIPDLARNRGGFHGESRILTPRQFLFFDLETTGLSGGAGTTAFLAAFGRFVSSGGSRGTKEFSNLEITQILLLDYPGEPDFLEAVLAEAGSCFADLREPVFLTTYNGKAFDTPILKTRCLLNGLALPPLFQVDLLHPSRRLWKRILPNCSQATIETMVLGLDRTGDLPGSAAPDIWFAFLRSGAEFTGEAAALLGICDHNVKDIFGLASLFRCFTEIAASPLDAVRRFHCDAENLALRWRRDLRRASQPELWDNDSVSPAARRELEKTAARLLEAAADRYPRSSLRLAFDLRSRGRYDEARKRLLALRGWQDARQEVPKTVKALALRALAIDAERRLGRRDAARLYIEEALEMAETKDDTAGGTGAYSGGTGAYSGAEHTLPPGLREDLERRREQLISSRSLDR